MNYYGDYRLSGDRIVEVPWIREKMRDVKNAAIADFGGIVRGKRGASPGWLSFGIHKSNSVTVYDNDEVNGVEYVRVNLLDESIELPLYDIGICVSAMEHFGLGKYGNEKVEHGDRVGLRNMIKAIKPGGKLYITVPCGRGIILNGWIREYTPDDLSRLLVDCGVDDYAIDYFVDDDVRWRRCNASDLIQLQCRRPSDWTIITGLACVEVRA